MKIEIKIDGSSFFTDDVIAAKKVLEAFGGQDSYTPLRTQIKRRYVKKHTAKRWNNEEVDLLNSHYDERHEVARALGRTIPAVSTKKWKIDHGYREKSGYVKKSKLRKNFTKGIWLPEEVSLLKDVRSRQELLKSVAYSQLLKTHTSAAIITRWYTVNK